MLAAWGAHEAAGRIKTEAQIDINDKYACADLALRYRAPLIAAILQREPQATILVEYEPNESDAFTLFDGRSIDEWIRSTRNFKEPEASHFRTMVEAATPPKGPLVTSAIFQPPTTISQIILWDGWHRAGAWRERHRLGKSSHISAFLILTAK
jgi:hypothetical protein